MEAVATLTGAEFDALPYEEGRRWELLDGELISVSSPTPAHQLIMQRILMALLLYFQQKAPGLALTDVEMALAADYRVRPDVLVILGERASSLDTSKVPIPIAPDIAVEIISPSERSADTQGKLEAYLRYGTREVWQVYPKSKSAVITQATEGARLLAFGDKLSTPLLPGFELDLRSLF